MEKKEKKAPKGPKNRQVWQERQVRDRYIEDVPSCLANDPLVSTSRKKVRDSSNKAEEPDPMTT